MTGTCGRSSLNSGKKSSPRSPSSSAGSVIIPAAALALYPAAVKCLLTDRDQLTSYLRFPVEHHRRIRHSNFIERTSGETRRRVKVIGRLPGEASCLNLVWAVLDRASRGWRGMTMAPTGTRLLNDIRHQLLDSPTPLRPTDTTKITGDETVGAVA